MSEARKTLWCAAYGSAAVAVSFVAWQVTAALPGCWSALGMLLFVPAVLLGARCLRLAES